MLTWRFSKAVLSGDTACADNTTGYGLIQLESGYIDSNEVTDETVTIEAAPGSSWTVTFTPLAQRSADD